MGTNAGSNVSATRFPSHQLSNGLYVSGLPEQYKDRQPTFGSSAAPYTGGDIKKSGELGKMFDIPVEHPKSRKPVASTSNYSRTGSFGGPSSNSGPLTSGGVPKAATSGTNHSGGLSRQNSGSSAQNRSGPLTGNMMVGGRQAPQSGPVSRGDSSAGAGASKIGSTGNSLKNSGPLSAAAAGGGSTVGRQNSGNLLPATGLITSGPILSGSLSSSGAPKKPYSGPLDAAGASAKLMSGSANHAANKLSEESSKLNKGLPRVIIWTVIPLFIMGFIAGGFILGTVHNAVLLIVVGCLFASVVLLLSWNLCRASNSLSYFLASHEDADLSNAKDGQYVKVTGVVTCGSVPLESSYQRVNRCIYTSTGVYEYRGLTSKPAMTGHRHFSWGLRYLERHVVDFYISDFQSGLRALVKAGYGASVKPYVEESTVIDVSSRNKELPAHFLRWMGDRKLSCDDRVMHLKEGYIKEGSTVTVMGIVQRQENVLLIVPPHEPISTGCQWKKLILPRNLEGLIISCEETCRVDGIPL